MAQFVNISVLIVMMSFGITGCFFKKNKVDLHGPTSSSPVVVNSIQVTALDKIVIRGAGLDTVTSLQITGKEDWTFTFDSQTPTEIIATVLHAGGAVLGFALNVATNFVFQSAYGSTPVSVTFSLSTGSVTNAHILNGTIGAADLSSMGASSGQVLQFNGTTWAPSDLSGLTYKGSWNATTDSPALTGTCGGATAAGEYYIVGVAGATNLDGVAAWTAGDWVVCSSSNAFQKIDNTAVGATTIDDLTDVAIAAPAANQVLQYNGANWINAALSFNINSLSDVDTATTPPNNDEVLKWNGTNWVPGTIPSAVTTVNGSSGVVVLTSTNIAEGTNLYFTDARSRTAVSAGTGLSYVAGTGVMSADIGTGAAQLAAGNHSHSSATGAVAGFMSAADKTKLDGITAGAGVVNTANVAAAGAAMDGDFTANGFMLRTGAGAYTTQASILNADITSIASTKITTACADNQILKASSGAFVCAADSTGTTVTESDVEGFIGNDVTTGYVPYDNGTKLVTSGLFWDDTNSRLGIGTAVPAAKLDIVGDIVSRATDLVAAVAVDWGTANVQYTTANCGAFTFTNMRNGGSYTLVVKGIVSGTCSFTQAGLTFKYPVGHGATTVGKHTVYTFLRAGSDVYISWIPGF